MTITRAVSGDVGELHFEGKLLFLSGADFHKNLKELLDCNIKSLSIYLDKLTFMDSAGLGMIMVAQKECDKLSIPLTLYHPSGDAKSLLQITKSYERFNIVD